MSKLTYGADRKPAYVRSQVQLDHDTLACVDEVVDLVNTDDRGQQTDTLTTPEQLVDYLDRQQISGVRAGTGSELQAVRQLRSRLRSIFEAATAGHQETVVAELNRLIADSRAAPRLVEHDGNPIHFHFTPAGAPLHRRLGAEMGVALASVVRDGGLERLRVCASPDCDNVLVDFSRNRSRRYCDTLCANRQHVAAYRARQRT
jgi:predicted RNA-binding Zn ribbon-like protein